MTAAGQAALCLQAQRGRPLRSQPALGRNAHSRSGEGNCGRGVRRPRERGRAACLRPAMISEAFQRCSADMLYNAACRNRPMQPRLRPPSAPSPDARRRPIAGHRRTRITADAVQRCPAPIYSRCHIRAHCCPVISSVATGTYGETSCEIAVRFWENLMIGRLCGKTEYR